MSFDHNQCIAISMYFADNLIQLRLWNGMDDEFKPSFVTTVLQKLGMWLMLVDENLNFCV